MTETLIARITEATKAAMRARDKARLGVLRMVNAAIKQVEVDERRTLSDDDTIGVLEKMLKLRREARSQYEAAGRQDRADQEIFEIAVINEFMPDALEEAEIEAIIADALSACEATGMKDMGKVMSVLRPQLKGRADMRNVSDRVKQRLTGL